MFIGLGFLDDEGLEREQSQRLSSRIYFIPSVLPVMDTIASGYGDSLSASATPEWTEKQQM